MTLKGLFHLLSDQAAYRHLTEELSQGRRARTSAPEGGKALMLAALWHDLRRQVLVITPRPDDARRLHDQLTIYLGEESSVLLLPEPDVLPFERLAVDAATNNQRLLALDTLCNNAGGQPALVIASLAAATRKTPSRSTFVDCSTTLSAGQRVRLSDLASAWVTIGYRREESVEIPGAFSLRGGIVDIFPPNSPLPARLDLVGSEIESLHLFDPSTQRSVQAVDAIRVAPAQEVLPLYADRQRVSDLIAEMNFSSCRPEVSNRIQDNLAALFSGHDQEDLSFYNGLINETSLLEYLGSDGLVVLDRESEIEAEASTLETRTQGLRRDRVSRGDLPTHFPTPHLSWDQLKAGLETRRLLSVDSWSGGEGDIGFKSPPSYSGRLDQLCADAQQILAEGRSITVVTRNARRLAEILSEADIGASVSAQLLEPPRPGSVSVVSAFLDQGWTLPLPRGEAVLLTDLEVFGAVKERRTV